MGHGKGINQPKPKPAGLNALDIPTNEASVPPTYFCGVRSLNVSWIMDPIINRIDTESSSNSGKKG